MNRKTALPLAFFSLSLVYAAVMVSSTSGEPLLGYVLRNPANDPVSWKSFTEQQVDSGASIPANTNVLLYLPGDMPDETLTVLFGLQDKNVRFWGYCFSQNEVPATQDRRIQGFPGKMFLSLAERKFRAAQDAAKLPNFSIYAPPRQADLQPKLSGLIRHQMDIFKAGMTCYVMTSRPLAVGTDRDGDALNSQLERTTRTDPANPDTDGDGVPDGLEVQTQTNPLLRDTDGDGVIDGLEDKNLNGRPDPGETDPRVKDSDNDSLCDGYCRVSGTKRVCSDNDGATCVDLPYSRWTGEDKNLNGQVDEGETDPTKLDSDGDGVLDDQEYYNCILAGGTSC